MPLFEYRCVTCGMLFEHFVRSAAVQEAITCPTCAGVEVSKQFSTFGVKGASAGGSAASGDTCAPSGGG